MQVEYETINGRRIPTHAIRAAHRKADETGIDHAVIFLTGDVGGSDGKFGDWFAVPLGAEKVRIAWTVIDVPAEKWNTATYVAVAGEPHD